MSWGAEITEKVVVSFACKLRRSRFVFLVVTKVAADGSTIA